MRLPKIIRAALDEKGKHWTIEQGTKHRKIKVEGRLVATVPLGKLHSADRATKNVVANIRRA